MKISTDKLNLQMARKQYNIKKLSEVSKVSRGTISKIKTGKTSSIEPITLGKLAIALELDIIDLMQ